MDPLEQRINTPDYKNWIKGTLAIIHICEAVRVYAHHVFERFKQSLSYGDHFNSGYNAHYMCLNAQWQDRGRTWTFTASCKSCTDLFNEVVRLHLTKDRRMGFENGRTKQVAGCWGIAKVFMPKHYEDIATPEDTDPYALFHMILNCGLFPLTHQHVESVITARNDMMHSRTNTLSDTDTATYINAMKTFLQEASSKVTGSGNSTVQDALDKARREIDGLLTGQMNIDILSQEAKTALTFKQKYISNSVRMITSSDGNAQELKEYLDILEKLGGELQFWNRHPWEIKKINELNDIRKQLETANEESEQLKEELKKAKNDLKDLQKENVNIARFQKEMEEVQEKLNEVTVENQKRKTDLTNIQEELNTSMKEKQNIKDQLDDVRKQMTEVDKQHAAIKTELTSVDENMKTAKEENNRMTDQLNAFEDQITVVKGGNKNINDKIDEINKELSFAKDESKSFQEGIDSIRKKVDNLELRESDDMEQPEVHTQDGKVSIQNVKSVIEETVDVAEPEKQIGIEQDDFAPDHPSNLLERDDSAGISEQLATDTTDQLRPSHEQKDEDAINTIGKEEVIDEQVNKEYGNTKDNTAVDENQ